MNLGHTAAAFALLLVTACGTPSDRVRLDVFAASSLTEVFQDMERAFEATHPDIDVVLTFAGSQVLRLQVEQGAPADVITTANPAHLRSLIAARLASPSSVIAHNRLAVIVPRDNPSGVETFADLPKARRVVIGTRQAPVGGYARAALRRADGDFARRVNANIVSEEANTRLVRAKVELGEADAAIVYHTDAPAGRRLKVIAIPSELNPATDIVSATIVESDQPAAATEWMAFVRSEEGQNILTDNGFTAPD